MISSNIPFDQTHYDTYNTHSQSQPYYIHNYKITLHAFCIKYMCIAYCYCCISPKNTHETKIQHEQSDMEQEQFFFCHTLLSLVAGGNGVLTNLSPGIKIMFHFDVLITHIQNSFYVSICSLSLFLFSFISLSLFIWKIENPLFYHLWMRGELNHSSISTLPYNRKWNRQSFPLERTNIRPNNNPRKQIKMRACTHSHRTVHFRLSSCQCEL